MYIEIENTHKTITYFIVIPRGFPGRQKEHIAAKPESSIDNFYNHHNTHPIQRFKLFFAGKLRKLSRVAGGCCHPQAP